MGAVNGIPRGGTDNRVLRAASGRGKEVAATIISLNPPWVKPLLPRGLLEMPLFPMQLPPTAANGTQIKGESSTFEGQPSRQGLGLQGRLRGSCTGGAGLRRSSSELGGCPPPSLLPFCQTLGDSLGLPGSSSPPMDRQRFEASPPGSPRQGTPLCPTKGLAHLTGGPGPHPWPGIVLPCCSQA